MLQTSMRPSVFLYTFVLSIYVETIPCVVDQANTDYPGASTTFGFKSKVLYQVGEHYISEGYFRTCLGIVHLE